jgi:8-oxo-dGTP pyrophosphatase MutT (NUDIX family)
LFSGFLCLEIEHIMTKNDPELKLKRAAGCVVYRYDVDGALWLLLIHDRYGKWTIPKGHLQESETDAEAAVREVFEETGIRGQLGPQIGRIEYIVLTKKGERRIKQVTFFLLRATATTLALQAEEGIHAAEWLGPDAALARIDYPQVREVLARALSMNLLAMFET